MNYTPTAIIYGASGDIASALGRAFDASGWNVTLASRNTKKLNAQAKKYNPDRVLVCTTDATNPQAVASTTKATLKKFGRVDLVVVSTGTWKRVFLDTPINVAIKHMDRHYREFMRITLVVGMISGRLFRKQGHGLLAYLSSHVTANQKLLGNITYRAGKVGAESILGDIERELFRTKARFTILLPGTVNTPKNARFLKTAKMKTAAVQPADMATWLRKNLNNRRIPKRKRFRARRGAILK